MTAIEPRRLSLRADRTTFAQTEFFAFRAEISLRCVGAIVDDLIGLPTSDGATPIPKRNLIAPKSSIVGEIFFLIMQLLALLEFTGRATNDGDVRMTTRFVCFELSLPSATGGL